jgi:hypothetical protein
MIRVFRLEFIKNQPSSPLFLSANFRAINRILNYLNFLMVHFKNIKRLSFIKVVRPHYPVVGDVTAPVHFLIFSPADFRGFPQRGSRKGAEIFYLNLLMIYKNLRFFKGLIFLNPLMVQIKNIKKLRFMKGLPFINFLIIIYLKLSLVF